MVNQSDKELSGSEYKEVMNRFSLPTQMKMKEIIKTQNCLYVYDAVNLLIFDMQYGAQAELQSKDDELKSNLKGKF
ncbi:hypothetical protein FMO003_25990 [Moritella sp. F3]|nr:hypothetical protein FMO001_19260 [Moritella sp. F1]GIC82318.1 hypothetical protein FMO003_25990 [Moritella sp. F3]